MSSPLKYRFDEFEADVQAAELSRRGQRLKLQQQPYQVLLALLERPGGVVTREELRLRLWPQDTFVDFDHSLNTAMVKLRDVLGDSASRPRYIETIAKRGYRFLGAVETISSIPREPAADAPTNSPGTATNPEPIPSQTTATYTELPRASRGTARVLFALAQILYLIFYLAALFDWRALDRAASVAFPGLAQAAFVAYLVTALAGVAVRLYLVTAAAFDYHLLMEKYRILFPPLFLLDMVWALAPLLLVDRMGWGLAMGACAALVYLPFAQRVLVRMMAHGRESGAAMLK